MKIAWIGTGIMGAPMCGHLMAGGHEATVFTRTRSKAQALLEAGATWADSPGAAAAEADAVFTIVGYPADVEQVYSAADGILARAKSGAVLVDMTTSSPDLAGRIAAAAEERGLGSVDAPVSGGDVGAREARLAIMCGGSEAAFNRVKPLLDLMGKTVELMGPAGAGQHTKMANQILIAGTMIGVVESLVYSEKAGLDLNHVIDVIGSGAAGSWSINNLGRRIAQGDFDPGFMVRHFVKDMGIALREAKRLGIALPGLALVEQFYEAAIAQGLADRGTHALFHVLRSMNGA